MQGLPRNQSQEEVQGAPRAVAGHVSRQGRHGALRGAVALAARVLDDAAALGGPALAAVFINVRAGARACSGPGARKESTIGAREEQWKTVLETAEEARKVAGRLHG